MSYPFFNTTAAPIGTTEDGAGVTEYPTQVGKYLVLEYVLMYPATTQ